MSEIRFVVDGMLGSLARKLRIFGFDVKYETGADDATILRMGEAEARVIVTADRDLYELAVRRRKKAVLLTGKTDEDRLVAICKSLDLDPREMTPRVSRCPICNGMLKEIQPSQLPSFVPRAVTKRHTEFYGCTSCRKIYWEGSHWLKIKALSRKVVRRLEQL